MNNDFLIPIGKRIAEIRRSNHVTQEALANELGVSPKHISHVECGTSSLALKNFSMFCDLFHCSLDYLIFGNNKNDVLSTGTDADIDRLNRYLQVYIELLNAND